MASEPARLPRGLYAITPEMADTALLGTRVEACLAGGAALLQYRAKNASPALALEQARRLAGICRARGVPFVVNDSIDLALACGADGVHVGREDADARAARRALPHGIVGVSCYADAAGASAAAAAGADYVAIGSVFASPTKPAAVRAPLDLIGKARAASGLPVVAIGGITLANAPQAIAAGADMVAVISAVFDAPDIAAAARAFAHLYAEPLPGSRDARAQPQPL
jgi:thiamine-phosphate pyrophosphorylase